MITKRYGKFVPLPMVNYCMHCLSPTYKSVFSFDLCCIILTSTKICHEKWGARMGGGGGLTNLSVHFLIKTIFPWLMIEITIKSVF